MGRRSFGRIGFGVGDAQRRKYRYEGKPLGQEDRGREREDRWRKTFTHQQEKEKRKEREGLER